MEEAPLIVDSKTIKPSIYKINDDLPLAGQEDGTWSISNRFVVENASDTLNGRTISSNTQSELAALADSLNVEFPNLRKLQNLETGEKGHSGRQITILIGSANLACE